MKAISSALLISMLIDCGSIPETRRDVKVVRPALILVPWMRSRVRCARRHAVAQDGGDASFHLLGRADAVDAAHDAARLVVPGEKRGLGFVLREPLAHAVGGIVGPDHQRGAVAVADP